MTNKDPHSSNFIRNPNSRRTIPTRRREINPSRSPLHIPDRFAMPSIDHEILVRFEGPESNCRVVRSGEEVARWSGGTGDGVEGEGVDRTGVGDEFP